MAPNTSLHWTQIPLRYICASEFRRWANTNMRKSLLCLLVVALTPITVLAEVECSHLPECWPEGSSMNTGLLLVERLQSVQEVMTTKHEELVKLVSTASGSRVIAALKTQQAAWLKYRSEECELVGSLTGAGGTWPSTYANSCEVNLTEQRLEKIHSAISCIEDIPSEERAFEQNDCLQQLAPLTNKYCFNLL